MTFVQTLNEYIVVTICVMICIIAVGLILGLKNGGWNKNLVYMWTILIYTIYLLISPLHFLIEEKTVIVGTDVAEYMGLGFAFNTLALFCFVLGYWFRADNSGKNWGKSELYTVNNPQKIISILFYGLYGVVLVNLAAGGANIGQIFSGNEVLGLGASGGSYFLQNFTDSLIIVLVLGYFYNVNTRYLLIWIAASFFLFSLLGFRYRILLSLFGFLFVYLYKNKITTKRLLIGSGMALVFFYAIMFSTENRRELILREYDEVTFDPLAFKYERFFEQTRGALPDMAIYRYYDNPNKDAEHDNGLTMFGYVFIRMIPRAIYADKDKFYPPPQLATTVKAYDAWWARFSGEATLSVGALYIAFGWLGIAVGHFIWGRLLMMFRKKVRVSDNLLVTSYIVLALASFQWITRGYFPQVIDHYVYMMIPVWIMMYYSKKNIEVANN